MIDLVIRHKVHIRLQIHIVCILFQRYYVDVRFNGVHFLKVCNRITARAGSEVSTCPHRLMKGDMPFTHLQSYVQCQKHYNYATYYFFFFSAPELVRSSVGNTSITGGPVPSFLLATLLHPPQKQDHSNHYN